MTQDIGLRGRRRVRATLAVPFCSAVILVLGWTALWLFGRHEAAKVMDAWIGKEQDRGRSWTCPDREIDGFPLRIRIACAGPAFRGKLGAQNVEASLSGLEVELLVYRPNSVQATSTGPLTIHQEGGPEVRLTWSALNIALRGLAANRQRAALVVEKPELESPDGASRADRLELRIGPTPNRPVQDQAYDVWLTLDNGLIPALDTLTRDKEPLGIEEKGVLTRLELTRIAPWQELAEAWRQAGGGFTVSTLKIAKGGLHVDAQGDLGLDDKHRIAGRFRAALSGYETLIAQLGVPMPAVSVGGALAQLWNRGGTAPPPDTRNKTGVTVPIVFADGRMLVGPFKAGGRLPPLY